MSPIKCRNSVLFPQPLPPMMMKMSPRCTVKLRSCISTKLPNAMVRSRTVMRASLPPAAPWALVALATPPSALVVVSPIARRSDSQHVEHRCEDAAGGDDQDEAADHCRGRRIADRRCAAGRVQAAEATGERDQPDASRRR